MSCFLLFQSPRGYIPFFLRDYPYEKTSFPRNGFAQKLHKMFGGEERTPIIYVEKKSLEEQKGSSPRDYFKTIPI